MLMGLVRNARIRASLATDILVFSILTVLKDNASTMSVTPATHPYKVNIVIMMYANTTVIAHHKHANLESVFSVLMKALIDYVITQRVATTCSALLGYAVNISAKSANI